MKSLSLNSALFVAGLATSFLTGQDVGPKNPALFKSTFGKLPIYFIENRGVFPDEVKYYIKGADKTLFFTKEGITFRLMGKDRSWILKLEFIGANPDVVPRGEDKQEAVFSYFRGPEKDWKTGLPTYSRVIYENLWPGIDLVYKGNANQLKYEFAVKPGADPGRIRLRYRGAISVALSKDGALEVETPEGNFEDAPPVAWQEVDGVKVPVEVDYSLMSGGGNIGRFGFYVESYDRTRVLVLDPVLVVYCGYIGGNEEDEGRDIAVDVSGNIYLTGWTKSTQATFPVKAGPDLTYNSVGTYIVSDAFVGKVNAAGTGLVYCGYIGGDSKDTGSGIAVDASGNAYVIGNTSSNDSSFPVKGGPDLTYNGHVDAFVAKVNAQGTGLVYCGYIGGASYEQGLGIAVDVSGNAYVTGFTESTQKTFPVKVGPDLTHNGGLYSYKEDAFVAKVNKTGTGLLYCGYIGGSNSDGGNGIAVDASGNAYLTGWTSSTHATFPVKIGPDLIHNGTSDAFVAKVNVAGTGLEYCGYVGGSKLDQGNRIAVDNSGNAYLTGETLSNQSSFPVKVGPDLTSSNGISWSDDAFVAKVSITGSELVYCGYIGGDQKDWGGSIAVDASGNAYVAGRTLSSQKSFPVKVGPDLTHNENEDAYLAKVNAMGTGLVYCGFIGGDGHDRIFGIAVDASGNAFVTGKTSSNQTTFPVKTGPYLNYNYSDEAFVAKVTHTFVNGHGRPQPGGQIILSLVSSDDVGFPYQMGTSLGNGPIPIGNRKLHLCLDELLIVSVGNLWPLIFHNYRGVIDSQGQAKASIIIPNIPALLGVMLHSAFVTLSPSAPSGIKSMSNTFSFSITK